MNMFDNEVLKLEMEKSLAGVTGELRHLLEVDSKRPKEAQVPTLTSCCTDDGGFLVVNGSAHRMKENFESFFKARPEFRSVVQDVLDRMYLIEDR